MFFEGHLQYNCKPFPTAVINFMPFKWQICGERAHREGLVTCWHQLCRGTVVLRVGGGLTHVGVEVGDEEHRVDGGGGHAVDGHPSCHCWWRDGERSQSTRHRLHRQTWAERSPAGGGQMGRGDGRGGVTWERGREPSRTIVHFHNLLPLFQTNNIRSSYNSLLNQCVQACWVNLVQMSIELDGWGRKRFK